MEGISRQDSELALIKAGVRRNLKRVFHDRYYLEQLVIQTINPNKKGHIPTYLRKADSEHKVEWCEYLFETLDRREDYFLSARLSEGLIRMVGDQLYEINKRKVENKTKDPVLTEKILSEHHGNKAIIRLRTLQNPGSKEKMLGIYVNGSLITSLRV